ncbi:MerR family transcriptional regulator [Alginatibacterium sediminis]|uniref:MerR family transcriptional regulator n=1 Tax=Alginatibacterium sediminis TaxID=2164068 RepID=A0A420EB82_9ALTE|nr:MerR family transcriptional regulator [Alginatibacterium sediminis]RKF17914.1 MerR family transcriptional regulator [Alginatibacterium sediminis]
MYIGEFAALTGTTPKTIRFYESLGLLPEPLRKGKYRIYDQTYVETVKQIKMAQDFGFKLSEIKVQMGEENTKRGLPASVIANAIHLKRAQIKSEIEKLKLIDNNLLRLQHQLEISKCKVDSVV